MITKIEVDGFKSLSQFSLEMKPGLNILVGPNGAGKTNIVLFFEFISNITDCELSEAFSKVGGAGSILKKIGENEYQKNITGKITGKKTIEIGLRRSHKHVTSEKKDITYSYYFNIELSNENVIFFKHQRLIFSDEYNTTMFDVEQNTTPDLKTTFDLHTFDEKMSDFHIFPPHQKEKIIDYKKTINEFLQRWNLFSNSIFTAFIRIIEPEYIYEIMADLKGGETFNIIPSEVKKLEDVAKAPGIQKNGSGLAATLYAMKGKRGRERYLNRFYFPRHFLNPDGPKQNILSESTFKKIIDNVKLANDSITNIDVDNEPINNNLNVKISIKEEGQRKATLSLSQMSDGTIKWITLITAIFTSRNIFSIEEPENFLHPWMQSEIVKIMRRSIGKDSFILMTTHSETLLNSAKPEEIIIVSMYDGKTHAKRVKNIRALKKEISNTGFGPGHFYLMGSLEGR